MKKVLLTLGVVCFSLITVHISTAEIDLETAVGIWLFDEGKGGTTADLSNAGHDGELIKSPEWVKGKFGQALKFDGKASCVSTHEKLLDGLEEFTILAWVQTGNVAANRIGLVGQNDSPEFGFINPQSVNLWTPTAGGTTNPWKFKHDDGKWHHVGCVATTDYVHVYIDGEYIEKKVAGQTTVPLTLTLILVVVVSGIQAATSSQAQWTKSLFSIRHWNKKMFSS